MNYWAVLLAAVSSFLLGGLWLQGTDGRHSYWGRKASAGPPSSSSPRSFWRRSCASTWPIFSMSPPRRRTATYGRLNKPVPGLYFGV